MSQRNIFWGAVLILVGGLFLLKNLDVLDFNWWNFLRLWPFLLVLLGIVILPVKDSLKVILTVVTLFVAASILIFGPDRERGWNFRFDRDDREMSRVEEQNIYEEYPGNLDEASISFDAAVGKFKIVSTSGQLFEFNNEGGPGRYMYSVQKLENSRHIDISLEKTKVTRFRRHHIAEIKLNPEPLWDIKVDVGAADIDLDLREFMVRNLDIDGGASSVEIVMGDKYQDAKVKIDAGVTSIKIRVPGEMACQVITETVLSSKNLEGFNKVADGTYVSENFSDSEKNIIIEVNAAVSSFQVIRY